MRDDTKEMIQVAVVLAASIALGIYGSTLLSKLHLVLFGG